MTRVLLYLMVHLRFLAVALARIPELEKNMTEYDNMQDRLIDVVFPSVLVISRGKRLHPKLYYNIRSDNHTTSSSNSPEQCLHNRCLGRSMPLEKVDCELNCTRTEAMTCTVRYLSTCNSSFGVIALNKTLEYVYKRQMWMLAELKRGALRKLSVLKNRMQDLMEMSLMLMELSVVHGEQLDKKYFRRLFNKQQRFQDSFIDADELNGKLTFFQQALDTLRKTKASKFVPERIQELNKNDTPVACSGSFLLNVTEQLSKLRAYLEDEYLKLHQEYRVVSLFRNYINIAVFSVIVLTGIVWNGTLLLIFTRHKELRTTSNTMLINLVIVDILNLVAVPPVRYITMYYSPTIFMGPYACRVYMFFAVSLRFAMEFSLLSLTAQRFAATTGSMKKLVVRRISEKCGSGLHIFAVWIASFLFALPLVLFTFRQDTCFYYANNPEGAGVNVVYMTVSSVIVPVIILVLSVLMSRRLRLSAGGKLGEGRCHGSQDLARNRSARVLLALAFLFILTHCPRTIWCGLVSFQLLSRRKTMYLYFEEVFAYLFFLNSGLNPLVMYLVSNTYRKLFNRYLFPCWFSGNDAAEKIEVGRQIVLSKPHVIQTSAKL